MSSNGRLDRLLRPASVAIVGASRERRGIGRQILHNLLAGGFRGPIYPVHPTARSIGGIRAYPSIGEVPDVVDLVVIAVPAPSVVGLVEECGRKGVGGLVIISAGFRETGEEGARREEALKAALDRWALPAIGPNCMGYLNTHPSVRLNATFSDARVGRGHVAFVSQSGGLGVAILEQAQRLGIGLASFVSLGNKTDTSTNDLLEAWGDDPDVGVILLYLENFGNPRKFVDLARRIGARKPIIAVKSGRTAAGARAAASHTGALAERDVATEALFEQCGVLRARTIAELFDFAQAFANAPPPKGPRVAILTNSGGPGIMATDALLDADLSPARFTEETTRKLRTGLSPDAAVGNPVDVVASGGAEAFSLATRVLLEDPGVDALLAMYVPPGFVETDRVVQAILDAPRHGKPVFACIVGRGGDDPSPQRLRAGGVPTFTFPESAVRALAARAAHARRAERDPGRIPELAGIDPARGRTLLDAAPRDAEGWLAPQDALRFVAAWGIPVEPGAYVASATEAETLALRAGGPVALKADAPGLVHKSDVGGVRLRVAPSQAGAVFEEMRATLSRHGFAMRGAVVQPMIGGLETILGATCDPTFGPLVVFGLGGIYTEVLRDVILRLAPLTDAEAARMVRGIRAWPILEGVRGQRPRDVAAVEDALLRLSRLVLDVPEVAEIDLNPAFVREEGNGLLVADARVRVWPEGEAPRAAALPADLP